MNRLRSLLFILGLMAIASLLIACGASATSEVPRITVEELKERLDKGEEIVVGDTRPASVYDIKHIPGAISVPASAIYNESPLDELPLDQEIVLYCT